MRRISVCLFSIIFFYNSYLLAYSSNPKDFVDELVNDAISKLADKSLNKQEKKIFIEEIALENVDINALGLYTLGELRKSSNKEDISNYQKSFEKYFLKSLTSRLTDYSSSKFEILSADKKSSNYTIVYFSFNFFWVSTRILGSLYSESLLAKLFKKYFSKITRYSDFSLSDKAFLCDPSE